MISAFIDRSGERMAKLKHPTPNMLGKDYDAQTMGRGFLSKKVQNRAVEQVLKELCKRDGIEYQLWFNVPFNLTNVAESLRNQARAEALSDEDVRGYTERGLQQYCDKEDVGALQDPAPIGWVSRGKVVYIDGNHRHAARCALGEEFEVWPELFIIMTDDQLALQRLTFELNPKLRGTTTITKDHMFRQALLLVTNNRLSHKDARETVGLSERAWDRAYSLHKARTRLEGADKSLLATKLAKTSLQRLGSIIDNRIFVMACELAHRHKMTVPGVEQLLRDMKPLRNESEALIELLKSKGAKLKAAQPPSSAKGTKLHPRLKTFSADLGRIINAPLDVLPREVKKRGQEYRDHLLEKVMEAKTHLEHMRRGLLQEK